MKKITRITITVCILLNSLIAVAQTGMETITKMHKRYAGKWYKTFTFTQTTEHYRNDSLKQTATWYEASMFPYDLRIDIGDRKNGNSVIYRKDSTWRFQKGELKAVTPDTNPFTFLLGGMYHVSLKNMIQYFQDQGYDLAKGCTTYWKNRKTLVVGTDDIADSTKKQFWVDAEHLYLVRTIETNNNIVFDAHMENHVKLGKGWSETLVTFYFNGVKRQVEKYSDLNVNSKLDPRIFEPTWFGKVHWRE